jgi:shikimate dehydrogenase
MHNAAYASLGMDDWHYQLLPIPPEVLEETVRGLEAQGFVGANVTMPHKGAAFALADEATDAATAIGATNTLSFREGKIYADNTDDPGFMAALMAVAPATPRSALVLGAGGVARGVVHALKSAGADVHIWNRTRERAEELGRYTDEAVDADVLVNCTSVGLGHSSTDGDTFKQLPVNADELGKYATVVDLVYRKDGDTEFVSAARRAGCAIVEGLEILVHGGSQSFEIWTGRDAPVDVMRAAAKRAMTSADVADGVGPSPEKQHSTDEPGATPPTSQPGGAA